VHGKALDADGEVVDGEADEGSLQFGVYFAQPTGTESKRTPLDNEFTLLLCNLHTYLTGQRKEKLRITVTAQGKEISSEIDLRFGRAKWLIVVDTETGDYEAHDNIVNLNAVQGAGIQTGQNVANLGAEAVITGNMGPNAFKTLKAANVKVFLSETQTVQDAVDSLKAGKLKEVDQANVEGHWI